MLCYLFCGSVDMENEQNQKERTLHLQVDSSLFIGLAVFSVVVLVSTFIIGKVKPK